MIFFIFAVNSRIFQLKRLLKKTAINWKMIKDEVEVEELKRHSEFGRFLLLIYFYYMTIGCFFFTLMPAVTSKLLDRAFPLGSNETRPNQWILDGEYLINKKENYWKLYMIEAAVPWTTVSMLLSIDALHILCINHCVALIGVLK